MNWGSDKGVGGFTTTIILDWVTRNTLTFFVSVYFTTYDSDHASFTRHLLPIRNHFKLTHRPTTSKSSWFNPPPTLKIRALVPVKTLPTSSLGSGPSILDCDWSSFRSRPLYWVKINEEFTRQSFCSFRHTTFVTDFCVFLWPFYPSRDHNGVQQRVFFNRGDDHTFGIVTRLTFLYLGRRKEEYTTDTTSPGTPWVQDRNDLFALRNVARPNSPTTETGKDVEPRRVPSEETTRGLGTFISHSHQWQWRRVPSAYLVLVLV